MQRNNLYDLSCIGIVLIWYNDCLFPLPERSVSVLSRIRTTPRNQSHGTTIHVLECNYQLLEYKSDEPDHYPFIYCSNHTLILENHLPTCIFVECTRTRNNIPYRNCSEKAFFPVHLSQERLQLPVNSASRASGLYEKSLRRTSDYLYAPNNLAFRLYFMHLGCDATARLCVRTSGVQFPTSVL
ncbi:hypothetical protein F5146DRAFT_483276 [Armillaria mellea]|nr:hypothetical protein F5146DRAFT_483276 [Armillaria mellea]